MIDRIGWLLTELVVISLRDLRENETFQFVSSILNKTRLAMSFQYTLVELFSRPCILGSEEIFFTN